MSEDNTGVPTPATPNWWLDDETRLKYRGPKTWDRNRQETEKQRGNRQTLDDPDTVVD